MNPKKKEQSLIHDRRNTYGENDKASRKSIRRRKKRINKVYRRAIKQTLKSPDPEVAEDGACKIPRTRWKKWPDQSLGDVLCRDLNREIKNVLREATADSPLLSRLEDKLMEEEWAPPSIRILMQQLRSVATQTWSNELDLDLVTARQLIEILRKLSSEHWATFNVAVRLQEKDKG